MCLFLRRVKHVYCLEAILSFAGRPKFHDTILLLLADHGTHTQSLGATLASDAGAAELRLPVFFLVVPRVYLDAHPWLQSVLKQNQQQLVTACVVDHISSAACSMLSQSTAALPLRSHDIYATLMDIASHGTLQFDTDPPAPSAHARSLFSPIRTDRSCKAARIDERMCACEA